MSKQPRIMILAFHSGALEFDFYFDLISQGKSCRILTFVINAQIGTMV